MLAGPTIKMVRGTWHNANVLHSPLETKSPSFKCVVISGCTLPIRSLCCWYMDTCGWLLYIGTIRILLHSLSTATHILYSHQLSHYTCDYSLWLLFTTLQSPHTHLPRLCLVHITPQCDRFIPYNNNRYNCSTSTPTLPQANPLHHYCFNIANSSIIILRQDPNTCCSRNTNIFTTYTMLQLIHLRILQLFGVRISTVTDVSNNR